MKSLLAAFKFTCAINKGWRCCRRDKRERKKFYDAAATLPRLIPKGLHYAPPALHHRMQIFHVLCLFRCFHGPTDDARAVHSETRRFWKAACMCNARENVATVCGDFLRKFPFYIVTCVLARAFGDSDPLTQFIFSFNDYHTQTHTASVRLSVGAKFVQ